MFVALQCIRLLPRRSLRCGVVRALSSKSPAHEDKDLEEELQRLAKKLDKDEAQERARQSIKNKETRPIFNWKVTAITLGLGGIALSVLFYFTQERAKEQERQRRQVLGKARIGGEWELLNSAGQLEGSQQLKGNWLLLYFGFTHCPDICPDEIEKMVKVVELLDADSTRKVAIIPVFISIDPERDTVDRVKKYCEEFSPKLRGFTGSKEQVNKVAKTFRVYHSEGPRTAGPDDYIVDHTVIMYLIDPDGQFHDYYGQNRKAEEIADVIRLKVLKFERAKTQT